MNRNDQPADTRIMGVVHSALRRDLARARTVLAMDRLTDARRVALAAHLQWMMDFLHHHHSGEDDGLYPLLLAESPGTAGILQDMDREHAAVHPDMDRLRAAAERLAADPSAQSETLAAVVALEASLLPHLEREELELMPLVTAALTTRQWEDWDQEFNVRPKQKKQLAEEGHWLLDGADEEGYAVVSALVPPVPRFIILKLLGGPYRRKREALWAGTPAQDIPSLTLAGAGRS